MQRPVRTPARDARTTFRHTPSAHRDAGDTVSSFNAACEHNLDDVIFKDPDSPYRSGRTGDWINVKCIQCESFFVVVYEKSAVARGGVGSLLLVARNGDGLQYVGSVGTGFKCNDAVERREMLDKLAMKKPPVPYGGRRKKVVWAQPTLIAEIEYRAWTVDGNLRHASFRRLRDVGQRGRLPNRGMTVGRVFQPSDLQQPPVRRDWSIVDLQRRHNPVGGHQPRKIFPHQGGREVVKGSGRRL
ncbi:hypothetical protein SB748_13025 [Rhizobium sp. SIMBA_035]